MACMSDGSPAMFQMGRKTRTGGSSRDFTTVFYDRENGRLLDIGNYEFPLDEEEDPFLKQRRRYNRPRLQLAPDLPRLRHKPDLRTLNLPRRLLTDTDHLLSNVDLDHLERVLLCLAGPLNTVHYLIGVMNKGGQDLLHRHPRALRNKIPFEELVPAKAFLSKSFPLSASAISLLEVSGKEIDTQLRQVYPRFLRYNNHRHLFNHRRQVQSKVFHECLSYPIIRPSFHPQIYLLERDLRTILNFRNSSG
ncbi:hypothetical protein C8F01DRAFT_1264030 [Mycena amicta]|nr:hypothetical protein C8F01DRAFT_1264030 [Mycena amicta]